MDDEKLAEMMARVLGVQRVAAMIAESAPASASGEDSTGSVSVDIAKNGDLASVLIASDWRARLKDRPLGSAVTEAIRDAQAGRAKAIASQRQTFVPPVVTRAEALAALKETQRSAGVPATAEPVDPVDLAERLLAREQTPPQGETGADAVQVTFASGTIAQVAIDQRWAMSQTAFGIAGAIVEAARKAASTSASDPLAGMFEAALAAMQRAGK